MWTERDGRDLFLLRRDALGVPREWTSLNSEERRVFVFQGKRVLVIGGGLAVFLAGDLLSLFGTFVESFAGDRHELSPVSVSHKL